MSISEAQAWVGIVGSLVTIGASVGAALHFQRRRDRSAAVGAAFKDVVESLASDNETLRMAAAILLRRFFERRSEQGAAHLSYAKEAVAVIAGLLRERRETGPVQKVLADGLRYAPSLAQADLQFCDLSGAYLGQKEGDETAANLTNADLYHANLTRASLKCVKAAGAVFFEATLVSTVLSGADLTGANFRDATLHEAKFDAVQKEGNETPTDLTNADLSNADLTDASLTGVKAAGAVFLKATLVNTVLRGADLTGADFRDANLHGANFDGAHIEGAKFSGASDVPAEVARRLNAESRVVGYR